MIMQALLRNLPARSATRLGTTGDLISEEETSIVPVKLYQEPNPVRRGHLTPGPVLDDTRSSRDWRAGEYTPSTRRRRLRSIYLQDVIDLCELRMDEIREPTPRGLFGTNCGALPWSPMFERDA